MSHPAEVFGPRDRTSSPVVRHKRRTGFGLQSVISQTGRHSTETGVGLQAEIERLPRRAWKPALYLVELLSILVAMKSTSMPHVGLFIPCYIDQIYPRVGQATLELLERSGCETSYPLDQKCCGQPMANTGCTEIAEPFAKHFLNVFEPFDYVVCPSGSCVAMVRQHYHDLVHDDPRYAAIRGKTYELCEFLHDVLGIREMPGKFPYRVGLHQSCHGLRELRLGKSSELVGPAENKAATLLQSLEGVSLTELKRPDECCGFGGTFAVAEEAVSCMMGRDRIQDHLDAGTEVLTAGDMSCLMHLWGLIARDRRPIRVMHVAEILAGYQPE